MSLKSFFSLDRVSSKPNSRVEPNVSNKPNNQTKLLEIKSGQSYFENQRVSTLVSQIRQLSTLSNDKFDEIYKPILNNYFDHVQGLPASSDHHHSGFGGLMIHTLETVMYSFGKARENRVNQDEVSIFLLSLFVACLLHDIGKISESMDIRTIDRNGKDHLFSPLSGSLADLLPKITHYSYSYRMGGNNRYKSHSQLGLAFLNSIVPGNTIKLISDSPTFWHNLIDYLTDKTNQKNNMIAKLVKYGDMKSVELYLKNDLNNRPVAKTDVIKHGNKTPLDRFASLIKRNIDLGNDGDLDALPMRNSPGDAGWLTIDNTDRYILLVVTSRLFEILRENKDLLGENINDNHVALERRLLDLGIAINPSTKFRLRGYSQETGDEWTASLDMITVNPAVIWGKEPRSWPVSTDVTHWHFKPNDDAKDRKDINVDLLPNDRIQAGVHDVQSLKKSSNKKSDDNSNNVANKNISDSDISDNKNASHGGRENASDIETKSIDKPVSHETSDNENTRDNEIDNDSMNALMTMDIDDLTNQALDNIETSEESKTVAGDVGDNTASVKTENVLDDSDVDRELDRSKEREDQEAKEMAENELRKAINGNLFYKWLKVSVAAGSLEINSKSGCIHNTELGLMIVTPKIFNFYLESKIPNIIEKMDKDTLDSHRVKLQKSFIALKKNIKNKNRDIFTGITTKGSQVHGFILKDISDFFDASDLPSINDKISIS